MALPVSTPLRLARRQLPEHKGDSQAQPTDPYRPGPLDREKKWHQAGGSNFQPWLLWRMAEKNTKTFTECEENQTAESHGPMAQCTLKFLSCL